MRLGVIDIGNHLHGRVVEAALLRLVVVGLRRRLEGSSSLRVGAARGDRRGVRAGRAAVAETGGGDWATEVAVVLGCIASRARVATRRGRAGVAGGGVELLLATLLFAVSHLLVMSLSNLASERLKEVVEVTVKILLGNAQIPLEQKEELLLHQVHLGAAEAEVVGFSNDVTVVGPVLVLR